MGIAIGGVVAVGNRTDEMGARIGSAATRQVRISFGQQDRPGGFDDALRSQSAVDVLFELPSVAYDWGKQLEGDWPSSRLLTDL